MRGLWSTCITDHPADPPYVITMADVGIPCATTTTTTTTTTKAVTLRRFAFVFCIFLGFFFGSLASDATQAAATHHPQTCRFGSCVLVWFRTPVGFCHTCCGRAHVTHGTRPNLVELNLIFNSNLPLRLFKTKFGRARDERGAHGWGSKLNRVGLGCRSRRGRPGDATL